MRTFDTLFGSILLLLIGGCVIGLGITWDAIVWTALKTATIGGILALGTMVGVCLLYYGVRKD